MKNSPVLLSAAGFVIAVGCALAPHPEPPVPYFGINPDTKQCTQGTLEGACNNGTTTQCTVFFGSYTNILAFDVRTGSICSVPVFRSGAENPDTLSLR